MKKEKRKISITLILLYVVFFSFSMMQLSQARYRTSAQADIGANTAKWTLKMNGQQDASQQFNINLNDCKTEDTTSANGVIAPGSKGKFNLELDCTGSQVAIDYEIRLTQNENLKFPDNITITAIYGGKVTKDLKTQTVTGTFSLEEIKDNPIKTIPIEWDWTVDETQDESEYQGENLQIIINITANQMYKKEG